MSLPNIRQAILQAADHIEAHPETFDFMETTVPDCASGTPGCALGWIAFFAGKRHGSVHEISERIGIDYFDFYNEMHGLEDVAPIPDPITDNWTNSASRCASFMRQYADKHYPVQP